MPVQEPDENASGNIFGWKISLLGAGVILFFLLLIYVRQQQVGGSFGFEDPMLETVDTLQQDTLR